MRNNDFDKNAYEWLGHQLGYDIWNNKYRFEGESFDEWLDRLSNGVDGLKDLILEKKFLYGGRILSNLNTGTKQGISNCFVGDTKIITKSGFRKLNELVGKNIKVLDSTGGFADATVSSFGKQEIYKLVVSNGTKEKEFFTTAEHIWFTTNHRKAKHYKETTTLELKKGMILKPSVARSYNNYTACPFGVAHGAFWGDGEHTGEHRRMNLCNEKVDLIKYFTPHNNVSYCESNDTTYISGMPKCFRNKPSLDETSSYLYGFLSGYFATDGMLTPDGKMSISSSKIDDMYMVQDILSVLGIPFSDIREYTCISNLTNKEHTMYNISIPRKYINDNFFIRNKHIDIINNIDSESSKPKRYKVVSVEKTDRFEEVYCAVVPSTNTFTLDGYILTHNCVTLGYVEDNLEDIMNTAKDLAFSFKKEAGVGICLSKIRPKGSLIGGKGVSDGVIGFLKIFNEVTANISRGNQRRGAMLAGLHCDHPDVKEFITIKKSNKGADGLITSANISVLITDEFMENYKKGTSYRKDFIVESTGQIIEHTVNPKEIMELIADTPKTSFEPGILFVDRYQENHLFGYTEGGKWLFNNACSEFIGEKGTVCLLGSMNLSEFVSESMGTTYFDYDMFKKGVEIAITALDKAHDYGIGRNGLDLQNDRARDYRGLGLGIMGLADMFMKIGVKYGSNESVQVSDKIASLMKEVAVKTSKKIAIQLGQPDGIVKDEKYLIENNLPVTKGLRNNSLLSIAPAGSIATMLGISTGIEPVFRTSYMRKTQSLHETDTYYEVFHKPIQDIIDMFGYKPDYCIDTRDVSPREKVDIISTWQKHVDLSISNTTNFAEDAKIEDIRDLYIYGWEKGVKGLTVYVDGSIEGVLNDKKEDSKSDIIAKETSKLKMTDIPKDTIYIPKKLVHGCGELKVMVGYSKNMNKVTDVYIIPKMGQGCSKNIIGQAVLMSQILRLGGDLNDIKTAVSGIDSCTSYYGAKLRGKDVSQGVNCPSGLLNLVINTEKELVDNNKGLNVTNIVDDTKSKKHTKDNSNGNKVECPECHEILHPEGGCWSCSSCGYSKCS